MFGSSASSFSRLSAGPRGDGPQTIRATTGTTLLTDCLSFLPHSPSAGLATSVALSGAQTLRTRFSVSVAARIHLVRRNWH